MLKAKIKENDYIELFKKYHQSGDLKVRDKIIEGNINLVYWVGRRMLQSFPDKVHMDDIYTYGIFGLMDAIEKFDIKKNIKFKTYACIRIRGAIFDNLRNDDPVPRQIREYEKKMKKLTIDYYEKNNSEIGINEIAKLLNININKLFTTLRVLETSRPVSIDNISYIEGETLSLHESIPCNESLYTENIVEKKDITKIIQDIISGFKDSERKCLVLYFFEDFTYKEIGEIYGVTESRICQIINNAEREIKDILESKGITKDVLFK